MIPLAAIVAFAGLDLFLLGVACGLWLETYLLARDIAKLRRQATARALKDLQ